MEATALHTIARGDGEHVPLGGIDIRGAQVWYSRRRAFHRARHMRFSPA